MDDLNKINRREFLARLLGLGTAIELPRLVLARPEVLELPVPLPASVVPPVLADEEPDEAEGRDIAWGVSQAHWTEEERQQMERQVDEFVALQASRVVAREVYLKKVIAQWEADGCATPWVQWHEAHFRKIYARSRDYAGYMAEDDLRVAMGLAFEQAWAAYERNDYSTAFAGFKNLAERGDARAQHNLGFMYRGGTGVPKDDQQAVAWYRKAAEQWCSYSQYNLGLMYAYGLGVPKDEQSAYFWFLLASAQGHQDAAKSCDLFEGFLSPEQRATAKSQARN